MMTDHGTHAGSAVGGPVRHIPVLLPQVIKALNPIDQGTYLDGTFGAGGYTAAILAAADTKVLAIDRDPNAIAAAAEKFESFGPRLTLIEGRFGELDRHAETHSVSGLDGVVFDLGVSSMQLDEAERGFSFQNDGPLDMRMSQSGLSAADIVNDFSETDLAQIFYVLGEEKRSRAIAKAIVKRREETPFSRTLELADIIVTAIGRKPDQKIHPATRTFQALRIYANGELHELALGLAAAEQLLKPGGRLVVVTFHSLEDRIVKRFLQTRSGRTPRPSRHQPETAAKTSEKPSFALLNRRPLTADETEVTANPRARSAKLRAAERTNAPPIPLDIKSLGLPKLPTP